MFFPYVLWHRYDLGSGIQDTSKRTCEPFNPGINGTKRQAVVGHDETVFISVYPITKVMVDHRWVYARQFVYLHRVRGRISSSFDHRNIPNCFRNSGKTANKYFTGTGKLVSSTRSRTHLGAPSSSSGKEYLNCVWGFSLWSVWRKRTRGCGSHGGRPRLIAH
jgi:hypothetical protein